VLDLVQPIFDQVAEVIQDIILQPVAFDSPSRGPGRGPQADGLKLGRFSLGALVDSTAGSGLSIELRVAEMA